MRAPASYASLYLVIAAIGCLPSGFANPIPADLTGKNHVFVDDIKDCPSLAGKASPEGIYDIRPDDFDVVMALGDSITAGLFAQSSKLTEQNLVFPNPKNQELFQYPNQVTSGVQEHTWRVLPGLQEYRGRSYATGADLGAITLPNLIQQYKTDSIKGTSHHHHPLPILPSPPQTPIGDHVARNDGLNAALSGSKAADLPSQVRDYLLPSLKELDVQDTEWKFMTLSIGANDVCDYCLVGNDSHIGPGSPETFVSSIETAIELVRQNIPRTIVNVVGLFTVSEIYNLTMKEPAWQVFLLLLSSIACSCAWAPGAIGDATREKMDTLGDQYAEGLQRMVKRIRKRVAREADGRALDFGIIWQPGSFLPLGSFPTTTLSPIDCFHPSAQAHERVATGLWNRLVLNGTEKRIPMNWTNEAILDKTVGKEGRIRCLTSGDRIAFD